MRNTNPWPRLWRFALLSLFAVSGHKIPADTPTEKQLTLWLNQLSSAEFALRERATLRLAEAGEKSLPLLTAAVRRGNGDSRFRIFRILREFGFSTNIELSDATLSELRLLSSAADPEIARSSTELADLIGSNISERAVAKLRSLGARITTTGGKVSYAYLTVGWKGKDSDLSLLRRLTELETLNLSHSIISDAALEHVAKIPSIQKLYLGNSKIEGKGLVHLKQLPRLTYLSLNKLPIDDEDARHLAEMVTIEHLGLDFTDVGDETIPRLSHLKKLKTLWLNETRVTDEGMALLEPLEDLNKIVFEKAHGITGGVVRHLTKHPNLTELKFMNPEFDDDDLTDFKLLPKIKVLGFEGSNIKGPGLAHLKDIETLRSLSLETNPLNDRMMSYVAALEHLETLGIDDTEISDAGLKHLEGLTNLRTLWLSKTLVTDASIPLLSKLKWLKKLYLSDCKLTQAGIARLQKALKGCDIDS